MKLDLNALKAAAQAADHGLPNYKQISAFLKAATPAAVLELIRIVEAMKHLAEKSLGAGAMNSPNVFETLDRVLHGDTSPPSQQPTGWNLVPWTPTQEMLDAAYLPNAMRKDSLTIYRAMIGAAPAHPSQQEDDARDGARYRALAWVCDQGASKLDEVCEAAGVGDDGMSAERLAAVADAAIAAMSDSAGEVRKNG